MPDRIDFAPVLIVGAGGHAKVAMDALRMAGEKIFGLCDADVAAAQARFPEENIIGDDTAGLTRDKNAVRIAIGVGSTRAAETRRALFNRYEGAGFTFATVLHPSAIVADDVMLGDGAQIMAGAVIQPGARIGRNAVINTGATIDHDSIIGDHSFVGPGATISGIVEIGSACHIGAGATIIERRRIGDHATIGAGAVVIRDIAAGKTALGVPARERD